MAINFKREALIELIKEPLRMLVLAIISWLITVIVPQLNDPLWVAVLTGFLRWLDRIIHDYGVEAKNDSATLGITRF